MGMKEFLQTISDDVKRINDTNLRIEVSETRYVPNKDDKDITYENLDTGVKKVKLIETCILYVDIRKSTELSLSHKPKTLTRLYSSFVKSMVKAGRYYGGHVRNIIGDRVMVVFDSDECFKNAVNTAILMNTIAIKLLNKHFKNNEVKCGIGIDYGKMLVTKVGTKIHGEENQEYKSLVWLGKPANIASKLTDIANKEVVEKSTMVFCGEKDKVTGKWSYYNRPCSTLLDEIESLYDDGVEKYNYITFRSEENDLFIYHDSNSKSFVIDEGISFSCKDILLTEAVYEGFLQECPENNTIKNNWWTIQNVEIPEYKGKIYGGNIIYNAYKEVE